MYTVKRNLDSEAHFFPTLYFAMALDRDRAVLRANLIDKHGQWKSNMSQ